MIMRIITAAALALGGTNPAVAGELCETALKTLPHFKACAETTYGVALTATQSESENLIALAAAGELLFQQNFQQIPPRYAIAHSTKAAELTALNAAGFKATLPWLPDEQFANLTEESQKRAVTERAKALNLTPAEVQAQLDVVAAALKTPAALEKASRIRKEALPHEIGHLWYSEAYWPGARVDAKGHYGGPGPDWLDEAAAIQMEPDTATATRRKVFEDIYRGRATVPNFKAISVADLIELPVYLTSDHPLKGLQTQANLPTSSTQTNGIRVVALSAEEVLRRGLGGSIIFYLKGRVFSDFLIERANDPGIFANIGAAFGRGEPIDQWLAAEGKSFGLPATVAALDTEWRAWLNTKFGPPVA